MMGTTLANVGVVAACALAIGMASTLPSSAGVDLQSAAAVWLFDDGAGVTAKDLTGKGNDGAFVNSPIWVDGKFGGALEFNGVDTYVAVDQPVGLPTLWSPRTITLWFKWAEIDWVRGMELMGWGEDAGSTRQGAIISPAHGLGMETTTFGFQYIFDWEGDTEWHHLAIALPDGEKTKADQFRLYLDGELHPGHAVGGNPPILLTKGSPLTIGVEPQSFRHYFEGIIDEVAIFPRELTAAEIKAVMQNGLVGAQDVSPAGKLATAWARMKAD